MGRGKVLKVERWRPKKVEKVKTCETMQSIVVLSNVILMGTISSLLCSSESDGVNLRKPFFDLIQERSTGSPVQMISEMSDLCKLTTALRAISIAMSRYDVFVGT